MLTLRDLADRLKQQDEISLLETLDITADELVERFIDKIEDRFDELTSELEDEDSEDE